MRKSIIILGLILIALISSGCIEQVGYKLEKVSKTPTTTTPQTTAPTSPPTTAPIEKTVEAIDMLPEQITGYETDSRQIEAFRGEDEHCGKTYAEAAYIKKAENVGGAISAVECDTIEDAKRLASKGIKDLEDTGISLQETKLEKEIIARWAGTTGIQPSVVIIWQQNNFVISLIAGTVEGKDPFDVGTELANSVILHSPV